MTDFVQIPMVSGAMYYMNPAQIHMIKPIMIDCDIVPDRSYIFICDEWYECSVSAEELSEILMKESS